MKLLDFLFGCKSCESCESYRFCYPSKQSELHINAISMPFVKDIYESEFYKLSKHKEQIDEIIRNYKYWFEEEHHLAKDKSLFMNHCIFFINQQLLKTNNMENKELKINVPEGYEIDKENSTFECIKFKKKEEAKPWRATEAYNSMDYNCILRDTPRMSGYYISGDNVRYIETYHTKNLRHLFATEKQAKSALAMAQISQIMANDERFGGPIVDNEWKNNTRKFIIISAMNEITTDFSYQWKYFLAFHTKEQRDLFLKENEDLVKDYLMIE